MDTCAEVSEEVLSSCDALCEIPYSKPTLQDRGKLMITNFRVTFVPYESASTAPVCCVYL